MPTRLHGPLTYAWAVRDLLWTSIGDSLAAFHIEIPTLFCAAHHFEIHTLACPFSTSSRTSSLKFFVARAVWALRRVYHLRAGRPTFDEYLPSRMKAAGNNMRASRHRSERMPSSARHRVAHVWVCKPCLHVKRTYVCAYEPSGIAGGALLRCLGIQPELFFS